MINFYRTKFIAIPNNLQSPYYLLSTLKFIQDPFLTKVSIQSHVNVSKKEELYKNVDNFEVNRLLSEIKTCRKNRFFFQLAHKESNVRPIATGEHALVLSLASLGEI